MISSKIIIHCYKSSEWGRVLEVPSSQAEKYKDKSASTGKAIFLNNDVYIRA